jgi:Domain of unknown function (DUF4349)
VDLFEETPGKRTIAAILGGIAAVAFLGLALLGGQTSSILSNVGNAIGVPDERTGSNSSGGGDTVEPPTGTASGGTTDRQVADADAIAPELLIIRTGQLTIEVGDLEAAVAQARARVVEAGGFVSGSDQTAGGDDATASVTFRIPADRWDEALAAVRGLAIATRNLHVETEAVTSQVIDLGARITNLLATEAALQAIMVKATKIPDVLDVQAKLTDVRARSSGSSPRMPISRSRPPTAR